MGLHFCNSENNKWRIKKMLLVLLTFKKQLDYYVFLFTAIAVSFVEELLYSTTNNNIYVEGKIMYNACIQKTKKHHILFYAISKANANIIFNILF